MKFKTNSVKSRRRAVALVTVLLVVSMLMILVITYLSTMQIEHRSAVSFADTQRAKMVSQGAVAHAMAILRTNIPDPAGIDQNAETAPGKNWIINPGRLTIFEDEGKVTIVPLHTGGAEVDPETTEDRDVFSVDLNAPIPGKTDSDGKVIPSITYALNDDGSADTSAPLPSMRVKWVNLLQDPSQPASAENPIVGRHAFWIDDECGKVNFNTALGKPAPGDDPAYDKQYALGMTPATFRTGTGVTAYNENETARKWALGKLRSVNLDVLFDDPYDLDKDQLIAHAFLRGFSRYPEAILDHVTMDDPDKNKWWNENQYNLTFYSRSPEFNAFGRPRFMTTNIPLSLEGGPYYQLPFLYRAPDVPDTLPELEGTLHMHALLGTLGFTHTVLIEDEGKIHAANMVNRAQAAMLMRYFRRPFPGYSKSFVDKYGEIECAQMAIDILTMARVGTTTMRNDIKNYSTDHALRSTSVLYSPFWKSGDGTSNERGGANPERYFWRFQPGTGGEPGRFLNRHDPSTPDTVPIICSGAGPYITEVRLLFKPRATSNPVEKNLGFQFEVEYYMPGNSGKMKVQKFPFKVDYFKLDINGSETDFVQELGPTTAEAGLSRGDRNWNYNVFKRIPKLDESGEPILGDDGEPETQRVIDKRSLGSLQVRGNIKWNLGPYDPDTETGGRHVVRGALRFVGKEKRWIANPNDLNNPERGITESDKKHVFKHDEVLNIKVSMRGGMGVTPAGGRPKQMFPIGENPDDVLEADVTVDMRGSVSSISWQIEDPRLSIHKDQWTVLVEDGDGSAGTPGEPNAELTTGNEAEPAEDSSEKSKFRYLQRGPGRVGGQVVNRPDEYNSQSRVSTKGYWSMIPTGVQAGVPWRSVRLSLPETSVPEDPPDWLLMDLMGATYPMQHDQWRINNTLPDEFSTVSYMHSTTGAINLNAKTYPDKSDWFKAPQRTKPLEAVFKNLRKDSEIAALLAGIKTYQETGLFKYVGSLAEVEGYERSGDATQFENEELLRNMIGCLTTRSNTFGVWGVGQVVKKSRLNEKWGEFEEGDSVRGEKRFFALIERSIWPGKDGVPGNAHVSSKGEWDRIAKQKNDIPMGDGISTDRLFQLPGSPPTRKVGNSMRLHLDLSGTYPEFDGPQRVELDKFTSKALGKVAWKHSSLEDAYNPPQPAIKYRVVYFKYLDE